MYVRLIGRELPSITQQLYLIGGMFCSFAYIFSVNATRSTHHAVVSVIVVIKLDVEYLHFKCLLN